MFGGRGMFDDPFFGDVHRNMRRQMQEMDSIMGSMMMDPFAAIDGRQRMSSRMLEGRGGGGRGGRSLSEYRRDPLEELMMPFRGSMLMGGGGLGMMSSVERMREAALQDPNSHVYSSSTVLSFGPQGQPLYQATDEVRKAGDLREVRHSVRDGVEGEERMRIGHHLGDRGHVIEKRRGRDGHIREKQHFQGLRAEEAGQFEREWVNRTGRGQGPSRVREQGRIGFSPSRRRTVDEARGSGPIITEVEDDEGDSKRRRGPAGTSFSTSEFRSGRKKASGPLIEEVE